MILMMYRRLLVSLVQLQRAFRSQWAFGGLNIKISILQNIMSLGVHIYLPSVTNYQVIIIALLFDHVAKNSRFPMCRSYRCIRWHWQGNVKMAHVPREESYPRWYVISTSCIIPLQISKLFKAELRKSLSRHHKSWERILLIMSSTRETWRQFQTSLLPLPKNIRKSTVWSIMLVFNVLSMSITSTSPKPTPKSPSTYPVPCIWPSDSYPIWKLNPQRQ